MIYDEKIQAMLDTLNGKLRILENAANGSQNVTHSDIINTINDSKKIIETAVLIHFNWVHGHIKMAKIKEHKMWLLTPEEEEEI